MDSYTQMTLHLIHLISRNKNLRQFSPHSLVCREDTNPVSPQAEETLRPWAIAGSSDPHGCLGQVAGHCSQERTPDICVAYSFCSIGCQGVHRRLVSLHCVTHGSGRTRSQLWQVTVHLLLTMPVLWTALKYLQIKMRKSNCEDCEIQGFWGEFAYSQHDEEFTPCYQGNTTGTLSHPSLPGQNTCWAGSQNSLKAGPSSRLSRKEANGLTDGPAHLEPVLLHAVRPWEQDPGLK